MIREAVIAALREAADPVRAPRQQAYMKSDLPYFGVGVPQCRRIAGRVFRAHTLDDAGAWEAAILDLWRQAARREERYAAIELLLFPRYSGWLEPARLPLIEELVVTGAWWDYVDAIAGKGVWTMLAAHPEPTGAALRECDRAGGGHLEAPDDRPAPGQGADRYRAAGRRDPPATPSSSSARASSASTPTPPGCAPSGPSPGREALRRLERG